MLNSRLTFVLVALAWFYSMQFGVAQEITPPPADKIVGPATDTETLVGVGFTLTQDDSKSDIYIRGIISGTPASGSSIQPGDQLVDIDGVTTKGLGIGECAKKLRGQAGTAVTVTTSRNGQQQTSKLIRAPFTIPLSRGMCPSKPQN